VRAKRQQKLSAEETATLLTHVRELQIRLLITAVVLVGAGVVAYLYYEQILDILRAPLNAPLYYNSVSGSFAFIMKICMVAGIAVSVPLIVYNFIMFVRPAFIEVFTRKRVFFMTVGSILAAAGGALFGFTFIVPGALHFFAGFQVNGLNELISADSYLNFVINVLITFILIFQLPILVSLIDRIKPISPKAMIKGEKWALAGSILISFLVPFAMDLSVSLMIAAPIFILYNVALVVVVIQHSYASKVAKKTAKVEARNVRRTQTTATRRAKKAGIAKIPVTATQTLAPHPQLAEVLALQASAKALSAKSLHKNIQPAARPVVRPLKPALQPVHKVIQKSAPVIQPPTQVVTHTTVSMDGMSRVGTTQRTQPTSVIRQAGTIKAPQRTVAPNPRMRTMNMMADIR